MFRSQTAGFGRVHSKVSYSVFFYKNLTLLPQTPRTKCANVGTDIAFSVYIDCIAAISEIKQFFVFRTGMKFISKVLQGHCSQQSQAVICLKGYTT